MISEPTFSFLPGKWKINTTCPLLFVKCRKHVIFNMCFEKYGVGAASHMIIHSRSND